MILIRKSKEISKFWYITLIFLNIFFENKIGKQQNNNFKTTVIIFYGSSSTL